jgi:ABC-2 type transport system permease protein
MLPPVMQTITRLNPLFYCFDFFRWSMIGYSEGNLVYSFVIVTGLSVAAVCGITYLFKSGYQLRS